MILLDTSVLVDAFTTPHGSRAAVRGALERGERVQICAVVVFEWLRGPRVPQGLDAQEAILPVSAALPFGPAEAARAAELYRALPRARGREMGIAIAACALVRDARLWTLNVEDFADIPGLMVERPA